MGEDLEISDVDVRQRKSGKNKNLSDDILTIGGGGGGHGSSKRRRRGRGGGDRAEGIRVIPEEEIIVEPKKGKLSSGYDDSSSDRGEIIAEVSENIEAQSSEIQDEPEVYQDSQNQGYFANEQVNIEQEPLESRSWTNDENNYQSENQPEDSITSFQEPEWVDSSNQQSDHDYSQQTWQNEEQSEQQNQHVEEPIIEQQLPQPEQVEPFESHHIDEPYELSNDEQLAQSSFETNPEIVETNENEQVNEGIYTECPEGSYWDGLSCVNPESFVQMDDFNNDHEKKPETVEGNIF
ncbi:nuclear transcription factor Y subunit beta-like [Panonychus citri]|uniref:nuclear transcription factor Y subunit beta-like n=1 Tax=Panonychus citri TaxID=50023 RepID=UPI0023075CD5|nr:nuclear transcription factor Y subunit beta-like [Panonychus citri]